MTYYPAPRTRSVRTQPIVLVANQYTLFGQSGLVPPTRRRDDNPKPQIQAVVNQATTQTEPTPGHFSLLDVASPLPIGNAAKIRANLLAIESLKQIQNEQRPATLEEQKIMTQYTGWGSLSAVWKTEEFEGWQKSQTDKTLPIDEAQKRWGSQYGHTRQRLTELLTKTEQANAEASTLNAFYTAPDVTVTMWQAVEKFGFTGGRILEPAAGIGYFIGLMPPAIRERSAWVAVEKDSLSGQILQQLYPEVQAHVSGLEQTDLQVGIFDLIIGNVPFGGYSVYDKHHPELNAYPIHNYFIGRAVQLVKPGGIVALITSMVGERP